MTAYPVTGSTSRFLGNSITSVFGFAVLTFWVGFYLIDSTTYLDAVRYWVPEAAATPFIDMTYINAQLDCWRQGVDVYASNPCDFYGRVMAYPPIWLRMWFLPSNPAAAFPLALLLALGFIGTLAMLPRPARKRDVVLLWMAVASSATAYGVERGNVDLLIFMLTSLVIVSADYSLPGRIVGHGAIVLAALLKFYPIFLLPWIAREPRRVAIPVAFAAMAILLFAVALWHSQWAAMYPNIPGPLFSSDGPGGRKISEGLFILIDHAATWLRLTPGTHLDDHIPRRAWTAALYAPILLIGLFSALRLARQVAFMTAIRALDSREKACLTAGGLLFCGCFVAGTSIAYREMMLLFTIPPLIRLGHDPRLFWAVRWTAWIMVPLMWCSYPSMLFDTRYGVLGLTGGPPPTFAFWVMREIFWWWLFIVLAAALFSLAAAEGVLSIDRRPKENAYLDTDVFGVSAEHTDHTGGGGSAKGSTGVGCAGSCDGDPAGPGGAAAGSTIQARSLFRN